MLPDDVSELRADFVKPPCDGRCVRQQAPQHGGPVWAAEVPEKADLIHAQLGVGTWANRSAAPCGWGVLRRGRAHRPRTHGFPRCSRLPSSIMGRAVLRMLHLAPGRGPVWPRRLLLLRRAASVGPASPVRRVSMAPASWVTWRPALLRALVWPRGRLPLPLAVPDLSFTAQCPRAGMSTPRALPRSRLARAARRTVWPFWRLVRSPPATSRGLFGVATRWTVWL